MNWCLTMSIEGKIEDSKTLRLRVSMATGQIDGHKVSVTQNIDGKAIFIEYEACSKVRYDVGDMLEDSWNILQERGEIPLK